MANLIKYTQIGAPRGRLAVLNSCAIIAEPLIPDRPRNSYAPSMAYHEGLKARWRIPAFIAVATVVAFMPALSAGFVTWDDDRNFTDNFSYRGLGTAQLRWMWTTFHMGHYTPLSWMTLGLDYELWGMNAWGYHLTSLTLHAINAVVFYFLACRLLRLAGVAAGDTRATAVPALAALLFAIHPLRAESVVWITERRDVLSLLFVLTSIMAYLRSVEDGPSGHRWYWTSVLLYVCALLSKATAMSLPAVLLVLNVYPLRRIEGRATWWSDAAKRVYAELLPFALLTAATVVLSIVALKPPDQLGASGKVAVSAYSLSFYLWKTLAPSNLAALYEMPSRVNPLAPMFLVSYGIVLSLGVLTWINRRHAGAVAAWATFVIMILPMLGVVQNGPQIAADRYTYHAAPALALLLAGALGHLIRRTPSAFAGVGTVAVLTMGVLTWRQTRVWHDSETLWRRVLSVNDESSTAHVALATLFYKKGNVPEAIAHYEQALVYDPVYPDGYNNLGVALVRLGRFDEAIARYRRAIELKPDYAEAHNNLGAAIAHQGDLLVAIDHYRRALAITPTFADAQVNWGNALVRLDSTDAAIDHYRAALMARPDAADAMHNWGVALARQGKLEEAIAQFRRALVAKPDHAEAREYLTRATELLAARTAAFSR